MPPNALGALLTAYREALSPFLTEQSPQEQQVLTVLNARDVIHVELVQSPPPNAHLLSAIHALDRQLEGQAAVMVKQLDFSTYRQSFPKPPEQWWWFLDETLKTPKAHPSDWVFKGATTLAWAISIGLLINISGRFLLGGAGVAGGH